MSNSNGPFQTSQPATAPGSGTAIPEGSGTSHLLVQHCDSTRRWVLFLAILATVLFSILLVTLLVVATVGVAGYSALSVFDAIGVAGVLIGATIGIGLYVPALVHLFRYASFLKQFVANREVVQLENALGSQKSFWKYLGILSIVWLAFAAVGLLLLIPTALSTL